MLRGLLSTRKATPENRWGTHYLIVFDRVVVFLTVS